MALGATCSERPWSAAAPWAARRVGTGEQGLRVVVRTADGVRLEDGLLEQMCSIDTQWTERERQCSEAAGGFEVLRPDGRVLVRHDFAVRPVCERQELTLQADGRLTCSAD